MINNIKKKYLIINKNGYRKNNKESKTRNI